MIIGVLQADELDENIIQRYGSHFDMVRSLLQPIDNSLEFRKYQTTQLQLPQKINECDAYIVPGSRFSVYEDLEWINALKQFVLALHQNNKKLVGICFGHQLIAHTLGGLTQKHPAGWGVGVVSGRVCNKKNWMRPEKSTFSLVVSHQDQVVQMPPNADLIVENDFCAISGFTLGDNIISFQGHPEFSNDYLKSIMQRRRTIMGEQAYQKGLPTINDLTDRETVGQWIVNFLKSR